MGVQVYSLTVFVALCIGTIIGEHYGVRYYDEGANCQQEEFQELFLSFNSVIETFGENHLGIIYS